MRADLARVIGEAQFASGVIGGFDGLQIAIERRLGVDHDRLARGQAHQQVGAQPAVFAEERGLRVKVAMLQHARHFDDAAQLDLAPPSARAGRTQRGDQLAGLAAQLRLRLDQAAHLLVERGVRARAGLSSS